MRKDVMLHNVESFALALFPEPDHPGELRIGLSLTFVGTEEEDPPDVTCSMTLHQAGALCDALLDLLDQAALDES